MTKYENILLSTILAPWKSDGLGDEAEWNLFDECLVTGDIEDRYTLSSTLKRWELIQVLDLRFSVSPSLRHCSQIGFLVQERHTKRSVCSRFLPLRPTINFQIG